MPVARYQSMIVIGKATMYRILRVKLNNSKILPAKPQAKEAALSAMHLLRVSTTTLNREWFPHTIVGRETQQKPRRCQHHHPECCSSKMSPGQQWKGRSPTGRERQQEVGQRWMRTTNLCECDQSRRSQGHGVVERSGKALLWLIIVVGTHTEFPELLDARWDSLQTVSIHRAAHASSGLAGGIRAARRAI